MCPNLVPDFSQRFFEMVCFEGYYLYLVVVVLAMKKRFLQKDHAGQHAA